MASDSLVVILEGAPIGEITRARTGALRLTYDDSYLDDLDATLLSVSMAAPVREHSGTTLSAWLWGLLPDNADVLARWGNRFGVSTASPFSLLGTQVGHDCAGAVQLCRPADVESLVTRPGTIEWLTDADVAERLRDLRRDSTAWLGRGFTGQFSLGGAQAKTALHFDGSRWGLPSGAAATTHILKPAITGLDGHDLNEHLCLAAARHAGLIAAHTTIQQFDDQTAVVVDRFDRHVIDGALVRIHQEDLCQAFGLHPAKKYQSEGGPSAAAVVEKLRTVMPHPAAVDATWRFVDALAFNWIIAGTDAHAKNYSLLLSGSQVRLAPLYDIASALPYDESKGHDLKLAMKLGGEDRLLITDRPTTWPRVARELDLDIDDVNDRVLALATRTPAAFASAVDDAAVAALGSPLPEKLLDACVQRAERCGNIIADHEDHG